MAQNKKTFRFSARISEIVNIGILRGVELEAVYWKLDAGYLKLASGFWLLVISYWKIAGHWLLVIGHWSRLLKNSMSGELLFAFAQCSSRFAHQFQRRIQGDFEVTFNLDFEVLLDSLFLIFCFLSL